jgi:hypothetical protein
MGLSYLTTFKDRGSTAQSSNVQGSGQICRMVTRETLLGGRMIRIIVFIGRRLVKVSRGLTGPRKIGATRPDPIWMR